MHPLINTHLLSNAYMFAVFSKIGKALAKIAAEQQCISVERIDLLCVDSDYFPDEYYFQQFSSSVQLSGQKECKAAASAIEFLRRRAAKTLDVSKPVILAIVRGSSQMISLAEKSTF